ncbi:Ig domain-containing protein [Streptacidiphilus jiangxiensis]|uniref:Serine protease n=1 Tax=Streptacidiphilus jiangxiensis TaxID=235985 RepID=A0A1H7V6P0_STRJI|nr:Ig domain-containing protein [Streptacidiphilus jiangxiensis]SEM04397.1 serine protease [Streptacidiphilus jiangxiensis]
MAFTRTQTLMAGSAAAAIVAATAVAVLPATASASAAPVTLTSGVGGHAYRHGAFPQLGAGHELHATAPLSAGGGKANETKPMTYHGGTGGVGVTTGAPKVYVIYWGSQWGTAAKDGNGYTTLSGDTAGMAPRQQAFFKGLGTKAEKWSGVMTQYCQGIPTGAKSCPATSAHVGYPTGGALAGVWYDDSALAPGAATANQIAQEAVKAAQHFGNNTAAVNRNVQYVITSPTGTTPDGFNTASGNFCAWHDFTGDPGLDGGGAVNSPVGSVAFTNMPYLTDAGKSCGAGFVNGAAGALDGVTIVGGHEYAETITDQFPYSANPTSPVLTSGGWITDNDSSGGENGDKCAWVRTGVGASFNLALSTGSFPVQTTWANDANHGAGGCEGSHPIVTNAHAVTVGHIANQNSPVGRAVRVAVIGHDSAPGSRLTYTVAGLPAGLHIDARTGVITGRPTLRGTFHVTVQAKDATGALARTTFTWTVRAH